jgi:hypothetical protein
MFAIYLCDILILIIGLIVKILVLTPVLWTIFFEIFIFVNLVFRYLHAHIVIIFWYNHLYLNYAYGVGKGFAIAESLNQSLFHTW